MDPVSIYKQMMDSSKPFEFVKLFGPQSEQRTRKLHDYYDDSNSKFQSGLKPDQLDYALEAQQTEQKKLETQLEVLQKTMSGQKNPHYDGPLNGLLDVDDASSIADIVQLNHVNGSKYDFVRKASNKVPIMEHEQEIIHLVEENSVIVIEGPTGCGKTTQVPQFILDHSFAENQPVNIVVTQPRKIAAYGVAKRVSEERSWRLGSVVGYKVGLKSTISRDTRLTYCTTGVLLQHLVTKKHMNDFTHVILDEVHERDQELDFLLLLVRMFLRSVSPHIKVILMSATFNSEKFSNYFCFPSPNGIRNAPVLQVQSETIFPVDVYHTEELQHILELKNPFSVMPQEPRYMAQTMELVVKLTSKLDKLESNRSITERGAVLVFLPGIHEIEDTLEALKTANEGDKLKWKILPLHSSITRDEQLAVFREVPANYRKIILSTNISESSITVPDVIYVIDACLTKQLETVENTNISCLNIKWASKVNCLQRKGRIGRVAAGVVFRLVPSAFYNKLADEQMPEMLRCPISKLVLLAKLLKNGDPIHLLGLALDPPKLSNIEATVLNLKEMGGLTICNKDGKANPTDAELTLLGKVMATLPIDIHLAKLVILGYIFGVYESSLIMASAMYVRNLLEAPHNEKLEAYLSKLLWANGSGSDCIALLNAFKEWKFRRSTGYFQQNLANMTEEKWARDLFIQLRYARDVADLVEELDHRLRKIIFVKTKNVAAQTRLAPQKEHLLLKLVIAGAFYPNYFVNSTKVNDKDASRAVAGFDPFSTVMLTNFPHGHPGKIYTNPVKRLLSECANTMRVTFDGTTRIYIHFEKDTKLQSMQFPQGNATPSRVPLAVYKAIKLRQMGQKMPLAILPERLAVKQKEKKSSTCNVAMKSILNALHAEEIFKTHAVLPMLSTKTVELKVTHVESPSLFYCQGTDEKTTTLLDAVQKHLNAEHADLGDVLGKPNVKMTYAVYCGQTYGICRARVVANLPFNTSKVFLIDYGQTLMVKFDSLMKLGPGLLNLQILEIPQLALECRLAHISPIDNSWHSDSIGFFSQSVQGKLCNAEVYSVVEGVVSVNLRAGSKIINDELVLIGFARHAAETYLSRENNEARGKYHELSENQASYLYKQQYSTMYGISAEDPEPPKASDCTENILLRGPFSPLETQVQHMIKSGKSLKTNVDQNSINSILLVDDPESMNTKFLVAGMVQTGQSRERLTLYDTTLMPQIPGLLPLICMIFSPRIELRTKGGVNHFTGMICGLGCEKKSKAPLYPEHDMELVFDTEFKLDDLQEINRLRFWMNMALTADPEEMKPIHNAGDVAIFQKQSQDIALGLLLKERDRIEPVNFKLAYCWKRIEKDLILHPGKIFTSVEAIFPFHCAAQIESKGSRNLNKKAKAMQKLQNQSLQCTLRKGYTNCRVCKETLFSIEELRAHLTGQKHMMEWDKIFKMQSIYKQES